jgi:hypothetical protein
MTNVTFSVDDELHIRMKKHSEIKWSEIFRKAIKDYLTFIERPITISGKDLFNSINVSVSDYSAEKEIEVRKEQQKLEKNRTKKLQKLESQFTGE